MSNIPTPLKELVERSKFLGANQDFVVYGGGNTSAKGEITDHFNRTKNVLWVKGSGADMMNAEAADYPALYMDELIQILKFEKLSDEEMTDLVSRALVDPASRRPSIETLLHAFLPFKHIDHVHADAICALTNHKNGEKAVKEALGDKFAYVDWIRPGFELSKQASFLKDAEGIILAHHGLIVWSDNSDECKQKNLDVINKVEKYLSSLSKRPESVFQHTDYSDEEYKNLLLQLRGRLNKKGKKILSLDTRLKEISSRKDIDEILSAGVSSADHMLRIKPWSAVLNEPKDGEKSIKAIDNFATKYENYFESNKNLLPAGYSMNDSDPRVVLVPDLGAITTGHSLSECKMYADISFHTHKTAAMAKDSFGNVEGLPDSEIFGFDYWPMELYKLASKPAPKKFAGNIFIVTGAASGIGLGITLELAKLGASLVLADLDEKALNAAAEKVKEVKGLKPEIIAGDQSDEKVVNKTVDLAIKTFGGLDGVVLSAGIAVTDQLKDLSVDKWNKGLAVNLTSAFLMTKAAMNAMKIQNSGGSLVYIASKNAFAPGAGFGGYSVSKAGMLQLMRIAALEGGANQIRANAINPDAIFDNSKLWEGGIREERAKAHGVKPEELEDFYAQRNILKSHVTSKDVANTTAFLLSDESARTTGSVIAVDGGVAAAFPR
jgi:rhamnulose-1-phosphate aldolase/alcohol dehydrogenase